MFARHAEDAIAVEKTLHGSLLADLGIDPVSAEHAEPAPANLAYTSYLLATVSTGSYAEGVGAVLPCYWIYAEVGKELLRRGSPDPRYQQWIDMYGSEEFGDVVQQVIDVIDEPGPQLGRPSATGCTATSVPRAVTSGCSGTWVTARKPGPSDPLLVT